MVRRMWLGESEREEGTAWLRTRQATGEEGKGARGEGRGRRADDAVLSTGAASVWVFSSRYCEGS